MPRRMTPQPLPAAPLAKLHLELSTASTRGEATVALISFLASDAAAMLSEEGREVVVRAASRFMDRLPR
jgi:hypothetical protein